MKASEGRVGRVFIIRLEQGDIIPDCIERFAEEKKISVGQVMMIGGIGEGQVVVGPRHSNEITPEPMLVPVDGAHEVMGVGVIAPDKTGKPVLHIHGSLGRSGKATTGACDRAFPHGRWARSLSAKYWERARFVTWMKRLNSSF